MAKKRIDTEVVIARAVELVDAEGPDALTVARVAEDLGVQASALYNHVDGVDGLRQAVTSQASDNLATELRDAAVGRAGEQAVRAVATAYRAFAVSHPGQYASTLQPPPDPSAVRSDATIVMVLARILETYDVSGDAAVHLARILRSAIHGFVTLEAGQAFTLTQNTDDSFDELLDFLINGLRDPKPEAVRR